MTYVTAAHLSSEEYRKKLTHSQGPSQNDITFESEGEISQNVIGGVSQFNEQKRLIYGRRLIEFWHVNGVTSGT